MLTLLVSGSCYATPTTKTVDANTHLKLINYMNHGTTQFTTHYGTTVDNLVAAKEQGLTIDSVLKMNQEELDQVAKNAEEKDLYIVKASNMMQYNDKKYLTNIAPVVDTFHKNYGDDEGYLSLMSYQTDYDYNPYQPFVYNPDRIGPSEGSTIKDGYSRETLEEDQYADLKAAGETLKEHGYDARDGLTRKINDNVRYGQFGKEFKQQGIDIDPYITELQDYYYNMDDDELAELDENISNSYFDSPGMSITAIKYNDDLLDLIKSFQYID